MDTFTLDGTVLDALTRLPLDGANVRLWSTNLDGEVTATTGAQGDYSVGELPIGNYTVRVTMDGYLPFAREARASAGATVTVNAELPPDGIGNG